MKMKEILSNAIIFATEKHKGQYDKGGAPYILHPLRVMLQLKNIEEQIYGVLHDTIEDCAVTIDELSKIGLNDSQISVLKLLTRKDGEDYFDDYLKRVMTDNRAINVKLADLTDNMDIKRIKEPTEKDFKRVEKYQKAYKLLSIEKFKMEKKTIKSLGFSILDNGYTCISVNEKDCPKKPNNMQRHVDYIKDNELVWSCHCYDTDDILSPVVGSNDVKCEYFKKCINGQVYCKLLNS